MKNRTEWVMHVWGRKRDSLELNGVEKFHLDMMKKMSKQISKFDKIFVNIAMDDESDDDLYNLLKDEISKVLLCKCVEFNRCQNDPLKCEYVTFRKYVFDRIGEDVNIFYSHFKGYGSNVNVFRSSFPIRILDICEKFWSYAMYMDSLKDFKGVQDVLNGGKSVYCWLMHKDNVTNRQYFENYHSMIQSGNEVYKNLVEDDLCKHSPGSFCWFNMKALKEALKDKPEVVNIDDGYIGYCSNEEKSLYIHFCELYLMNFLKVDDIYSVREYDENWKKVIGVIYCDIYPSKLVCREYLSSFDKYLIETNQI